MDPLLLVEQYNHLINKSYLALWRRQFKSDLAAEDFAQFPIALLDISKIYCAITRQTEFEEKVQKVISDKLIDIKLLFLFLINSTDRFYFGPVLIVGNGELEKADEKTLSWLQLTHYKVYLITTIYEKLVDLFEIIFLNKQTDYRKDKIGKKLTELWNVQTFNLVAKDEHELLKKFRNTARRGEIHGTSTVFRQLLKNEWNHFAKEEDALNDIIKKFYKKYNIDNS